MSETWRLIDMRVEDAYTQMAIDEALAFARRKGESPNTVRLYRWNPSAVSVGYFQSTRNEVDLKACGRLGVDVIRRITGGGTVFHDYEGEITYSLVAPDDDPKIPRDILSSYSLICKGVVKGLGRLGLKAEFKPINDIISGDKKISGNAQTRRYGSVLQHGTILVDCDVRKMFTVLKVSETKISDKMIEAVEERVTSIRRELGRDVSFSEARDALVSGFEEALDIHLEPGSLTAYEQELTEKFREKYSSSGWIFKR
jgi:lipoate-protein ligase A